VVVSYETILALMLQVRCGFAHRVKAARCKSGSTWPLGEMSVTPCGEPHLLRQVVDQPGAKLDILLKKRHNKAAAKQFSKQVLAACPEGPCKIVTDQLHSYPAAKAELSELTHVKHVFVKASARLNNRAENSHWPTRERERRMRGIQVLERAQALLSLRTDSTSRSSDIYCALRFTLSNSANTLPLGID
jgi:putative transposase